jgi:hypothetical protein
VLIPARGPRVSGNLDYEDVPLALRQLAGELDELNAVAVAEQATTADAEPAAMLAGTGVPVAVVRKSR